MKTIKIIYFIKLAYVLIPLNNLASTKAPKDVLDVNIANKIKAAVTGLRGEINLVEIQSLFQKDPEQLNNIEVNSGNTSLMLAIGPSEFPGREDIVELLLNLDADANAKNKEGETALIMAAKQGKENIAKKLLKNPRIIIDARDNSGYTALMHAVNKLDVEIIKSLLKRNADRNQAVVIAQRTAVPSLAKLIRPLSPEIIKAASAGLIDQIQKYLDANYINASTIGTNKTLLMLAVENGHIPLVRFLLEYKGSPEEMKSAASQKRGHYKYIAFPTDTNEIDVNEQDHMNFTALHYAVRMQNVDMVRLLLAANADSLIKADNGQTPLSLAILIGNSAIVKLLLEGQDRNNKLVQEALTTQPAKNAAEIEQIIKETAQ